MTLPLLLKLMQPPAPCFLPLADELKNPVILWSAQLASKPVTPLVEERRTRLHAGDIAIGIGCKATSRIHLVMVRFELIFLDVFS